MDHALNVITLGYWAKFKNNNKTQFVVSNINLATTKKQKNTPAFYLSALGKLL